MTGPCLSVSTKIQESKKEIAERLGEKSTTKQAFVLSILMVRKMYRCLIGIMSPALR